MARRDGTGPFGQGPMTGRGFGPCGGGRAFGGYRPRRALRGRGPGAGVGYGYGGPVQIQEREGSLAEYKEMLKKELTWVNEELQKD